MMTTTEATAEDRYLVPIPRLTKRLHERSHEKVIQPLFDRYTMEIEDHAVVTEQNTVHYSENGLVTFVTGPRYRTLIDACFTAVAEGVKEIVDTQLGKVIQVDSTLKT